MHGYTQNFMNITKMVDAWSCRMHLALLLTNIHSHVTGYFYSACSVVCVSKNKTFEPVLTGQRYVR